MMIETQPARNVFKQLKNMIMDEDNNTDRYWEEDIERLKDWLSKQPHLPHNIDEMTLSSFVYGTKSIEIAKQKLDAYLSWRANMPKFFSFKRRDAKNPEFRDCTKAGELFFLPKPTPEGYRVLFGNLKGSFVQSFNDDQAIVGNLMSLELALNLWPSMRGIIYVGDLKEFVTGFVLNTNVLSLASALRCFQECYPIRLKAILLFNTGHLFDKAFNQMIKPFLSNKLLKKVNLTSEDECNFKMLIPKEIIPSNYGGKEKSSEELNAEWLKLLEEKRDWFKLTSELVADLSKKPPDKENTYGVEGTFRKLALD